MRYTSPYATHWRDRPILLHLGNALRLPSRAHPAPYVTSTVLVVCGRNRRGRQCCPGVTGEQQQGRNTKRICNAPFREKRPRIAFKPDHLTADILQRERLIAAHVARFKTCVEAAVEQMSPAAGEAGHACSHRSGT